MVKNPHPNAGDTGSIPGSGRPPGGGNGNPLQCSCLENPTDRGAWRATVCGVAEEWTRLSASTTTAFHGGDSQGPISCLSVCQLMVTGDLFHLLAIIRNVAMTIHIQGFVGT